LIERLGSAFSRIDLDGEYLESSDLEHHVLEAIQLPPTSPYHDPALDTAARTVARTVAERAGTSFLIASRTAASIAQSNSPLDTNELSSLPTTVGEVFARELESLPQAGRKRLRAVLAALSFAEGRGLPRDLWAPVAAELGGTLISEGDVERAAEDADYYIAVDE
jgi:hypothetical protein